MTQGASDEEGGGAWVAVPDSQSMSDGDMKALEIGDEHVLLCRIEGQFYASSNVCTHAFAILSDGWLDGEVIECPLHAGCFNVRTGEAMGDPVERNLKTFQVRVRDSVAEILVPEG